MSKQDLVSFYSKRKAEFSARLESVTKKINLISNTRLLVAFLFIVLFYFGYSQTMLLYGLLPIAIVFAMLVKKHAKLFDEKTHLENLVNLNRLEIQALSGDLSAFRTGSEFTNSHHPYSYDLDIF